MLNINIYVHINCNQNKDYIGLLLTTFTSLKLAHVFAPPDDHERAGKGGTFGTLHMRHHVWGDTGNSQQCVLEPLFSGDEAMTLNSNPNTD